MYLFSFGSWLLCCLLKAINDGTQATGFRFKRLHLLSDSIHSSFNLPDWCTTEWQTRAMTWRRERGRAPHPCLSLNPTTHVPQDLRIMSRIAVHVYARFGTTTSWDDTDYSSIYHSFRCSFSQKSLCQWHQIIWSSSIEMQMEAVPTLKSSLF